MSLILIGKMEVLVFPQAFLKKVQELQEVCNIMKNIECVFVCTCVIAYSKNILRLSKSVVDFFAV